MTAILFLVIPEKGHVNPYIGPAQVLRAMGADVSFHAAADISRELAAAGLSNFIGPVRRPEASSHRGAAFAKHVRDPAWLRAWIRALLIDASERDVEPTREILRRVRPNVVALDPMMYAAVIACELEGIPWAAVSNSLNPALPDDLDSELLRTVAWLADDRRALFARYGLAPRFHGCDVLSPFLTIAFTTEALVGAVDGVKLVGPSLPRDRRGDETDFPWDWLDPKRSLVYASFGSQLHHQPVLFRTLIEAARGRDVQLVLSAADLADSPELGSLPDNTLARPYVPQLDILRRASAFVTHGGANSVMEAIALGVPMLLIPLCNDQVHQAHFVTRAGIGRSLGAAVVTAEASWNAIRSLIADGPERHRLEPVSASYRRDGSAESARLLIELAARSPRARGS